MKTLRIFSALVSVAYICSLVSCNPEGIKPTPGNYIISGPQDVEPAFSPDGSFIAYAHLYDTAKNYPQGLYIIDRNGNNRKLVLAGFHFTPAWSPDGQWLVFTSGGTLQKCKIDGSELTVFTELTQLKYREFYYPDWSRDGKYIVFDNPFPSDGGGIFQIDSDFTNAKILFGLDQSGTIGRDPEFSPDQKHLIFYSGTRNYNYSDIFLSDNQGNQRIRLTSNGRNNTGPAWSPDGNKIAWDGDFRLGVMNADGSSQTVIGYGNSPSWSINNEIVYSHANADYSKEVLYVISPDGKNKRQVTQ
jgi:Tol biopolymer transport system component